MEFSSTAWRCSSMAFTIVTFLIVQTSQNRAITAVQIKLDELLSAVKGVRDELLEDLDDELERLQAKFSQWAQRKRAETEIHQE